MSTDVLILGAGPAGTATALLLAQQGLSVEVIDPASFPRPKICGEFLNPQAVRWLDEHGLLPLLLQANPFPIAGMKISDISGACFTGHYRPPSTGYAVLRKDFDALLVACARQAGITIYEGHLAQRLLFDGNRVIGVSGIDSDHRPFEKRASITVGADGRNNLIGRTFGWIRQMPSLRKYAFVTYFQDVLELTNFGEIHLVPGGYIGIAPITPDLANVSLVLDERECPPSDIDRAALLISRMENTPLKKRFDNLLPVAPVSMAGPLAFTMKRTSGYQTMVVGDACGFIDPFTGEGINYAFLTAEIAADVLVRAFQQSAFDDALLLEYDRRRIEALGRKFRMAQLFQKAIAHPSLSRFLISRFSRSLDLGDTIVSAVGSAIPLERVWNIRFLLRVAAGIN